MEINLSLLSVQNPWWSIGWNGEKKPSQAGQGFDPVLDEFDSSSVKWKPAVLNEINFDKDLIYFLQGPPAAGKTTAVKLLIGQLTQEKKVDPDNVFYYSCANFYTFEQLNQSIKVFLKWRRGIGQKERHYIFIDEIEFISNWENGIKHLHEAGVLKNTTLVVAGSVFNKKQSEKKFIINKNINPLDFGEFIRLINPNFQNITPGNYDKFSHQLDYYLDIYFLTGGYIGAINSFRKNGAVSQSLYDNYVSWLMHDVARMGRDIVLLKQILIQILENFGQPVGYQTIAKKTKARTHLTISEYLDILESMYFIKPVYQSSGNSKPASQKAKKIYFYDSFIFSLTYSYAHGSLNYWQFSRERLHDEEFHSQLVENIVLSHLIQTNDNIFYWRDNIKKLQIDFITKYGKNIIPVLIRYNQNISEGETKIFKAAGCKKGIIISRDQLDLKSNYKIIPLTYFLLFYKNLI